MKRAIQLVVPALMAGLLAGGCSIHSSPISTWYFFDEQTGAPLDNVLLLEWTEQSSSPSPEAHAFEQQVPSADTLAGPRAGLITRADPRFKPGLKASVQAYAMAVSQRSRYMAAVGDYDCRVKFANQESLAKLGVESAGDESVAYVLLTRQVEPGDAVDWLHWLTNGRPLLRENLGWQDRRRVYEAFGKYWERTTGEQGAAVAAELNVRPPTLLPELSRIYREELSRPPTTAAER